jgi:WD40 repeat protein/tRNA A-37 threonylcarbamoyl transferase component Bud32
MTCPTLEELELGSPSTQAHVATCQSCQAVDELVARRRARLTEGPCAPFEALIALAESETLSTADATALEAHLAACDACQSIAGATAPLDALISDHADLPTVGHDAYVVGAEIAHGGMGRVLEARDRRIGRPVALKEMLDASPATAARFEREARLTARLQHPGIVSIYEIGRWPEGRPFYVMPRLPGRTLREAIQKAPSAAERIALLPLVIAATEAVAYAHSKRIIHRDLTPSNILLGSFGETLVIDWGLAKDLASPADDEAPSEAVPPASRDGELTHAGAVLGTAAYMPPEQAAAQTLDEHGDVYALGAILYHLVGGQAPYRGATTDEILEQVRRGPPPSLSGPPDLVSIIAKAMSREPSNRYASARELAEELNRFVAGQLVGARTYSLMQLLRRWVARHRALVTVSVVALLLLAALGTFSSQRIVRERDRALAANASLLADEGRHELLAGSPARALAYLSAAYSAGVDDAATRYLLHVATRNVEALALVTEGTLDRNASHVFSPDGARLAVQRRGAVVVLDTADAGVHWSLPHEDAARFTPDGDLLTRSEGAVRLHDGQRGELLRSFEHPGGVDAFELSADGKRLLTSSKLTESARVYDLASGKLLFERQAATPMKHPLRASLSPDGRLVALSVLGEPAQVAAVDGGQLVMTLAASSFFAWDAKSSQVLAQADDGVVSIVDAVTGKPVRRLTGEGQILLGAAFNASGTRVAGTFVDGGLRLWDTATGQLVARVGGSIMTFGVFDPEGERLAAISGPLVRLYSARHGGLLATWEGPSRVASTGAFSDDGSRLLTSASTVARLTFEPSEPEQATALLWNTTSTVETVIHSASPLPLGLFGDTSTRLVTMSADERHLLVFDLSSGHLVRDLGPIRTFGVASEADRVLAVRPDAGVAQLVDVNTFETTCQLETANPVAGASISERGETIVTWSEHAAPELWDGATCRRLAQLELPPEPLDDVTLSGSGARALIQRKSGKVELWDLRRARRVTTLDTRYNQAFWSADEQWVVTSHWTGDRAVVWDATGKALYAVPQPFMLGSMSADSRLFAAPRPDVGGVRLLESATGQLVGTMPGDHTGTMFADFSADSQLIVTSEFSNLAKVWDRHTARELDEFSLPATTTTLTMPRHGVGGDWQKAGSIAGFSRRHRLLGAGADGSVVVYDFGLEQRSPQVVARLTEALVPWKVVEGRLVSTQPDPVLPVAPSSPPMGTAAGRVTHDGRPVAQAEVRAWGATSVTTSSDGTFTIELPPGSHDLAALSLEQQWYGTRAVKVNPAERTTADLELTLGPSVTGRVVDEHGVPMTDVFTCFVQSFDQLEAHAAACAAVDQAGRFAVFGLKSGRDAFPHVGWKAEYLEPAAGRTFSPVRLADEKSSVRDLTLTVKRQR